MMIERDVKRTMSEQLADDLGRSIVEGGLRPGDPLPNEEALLARFGVSRTVLREAIQALAAKGLLDARPRRGTSVRPMSQWSQLDAALLDWHARLPPGHPALVELMEMRCIVEPQAAALAAQRGSPADKARIQTAYDAMTAARGAVVAFSEADLDFHSAILEAAGNRFLLPVAHAIRTTLLASLRLTNPRAAENRQVSLPLHAAILRAILAGDAVEADEAMRTHLVDTERRHARAAKLERSRPIPAMQAFDDHLELRVTQRPSRSNVRPQ